MSTEMLEAARRYVAAGLSVIPIRRWSKRIDYLALGHPAREPLSDAQAAALWQPFTERLPDDADLRHWFTDTDCGIGIVGGAVSGGLVRLDFEHTACLHTWYQLLFEDMALSTVASGLPVVQTAKGHHVYFRMADPPGHVVLCSGLSGDDLIVFSETQGEGCYCLAPPTPMYTEGGELTKYLWCGLCGPEAIPTLGQELASRLIDRARFPGFWEPTFAAPWSDRTAELSRNGMLLHEPHGRGGALWLDWPHIAALRTYLDRYAGLLRAVETAPPPAPSYNEAGEDDDAN